MKKRRLLIIATAIVVLAAAVPLGRALAGVRFQAQPTAPEQIPEIPDLSTLLNYEYRVQVLELEEPERSAVITELMARPETMALAEELVPKGFVFDPVYVQDHAVAMSIVIDTPTDPVEVRGMTVSMIVNELSAALTAMQPVDQSLEGFYQAHHTNLDPNLAEVPDPPIIVNGMPYFYITTLRWIGGRIIYWRYWWFDSHHHPNWYYAHYYWYWKYYAWYGWSWHHWYWWVHGWYYWRYWYFWSTWFPWHMSVDVPVP